MRFRKHTRRVPVALGNLEVAVLRELWRVGADVDARGVLEALAERRITLSTIQATLERLSRKGLLERTTVGRAYRYRAAVTQSTLLAGLIGNLARQVAAGELEPVISGFVELVGDASPELLDVLAAEAAQRRKERP
jgi:predicted transcriptional regulator